MIITPEEAKQLLESGEASPAADKEFVWVRTKIGKLELCKIQNALDGVTNTKHKVQTFGVIVSPSDQYFRPRRGKKIKLSGGKLERRKQIHRAFEKSEGLTCEWTGLDD